jgi:hypothetical protein
LGYKGNISVSLSGTRPYVYRAMRLDHGDFRSTPVNGHFRLGGHVSKVPNADISGHQFNDPLRVVSAGDAKLTLRG